MVTQMVNKKNRADKHVLIHIFSIIYAFVCIMPFLLVVSASFSNEIDILNYGYRLIPKKIDLLAYRYVFENPKLIVDSYFITTVVTIVGTFVSVLIMAMSAYPLSRTNFKYRRLMSFYIFFTMLFSGGLVPSYILITQFFKMQDTVWVLIIPGLVNAFHIIMLRTFFQKTPESLFESAKLDGATEFRILFSIALPLCVPALATVAFFGAMARWNDWYTALLYITKNELMPLQFLLYRIMANVQFVMDAMEKAPSVNVSVQDIPGENLRMAMLVVAAGPMIAVFPFFQKYFVQGLTVGSVKG